jgi:chromosome segregation ATPase
MRRIQGLCIYIIVGSIVLPTFLHAQQEEKADPTQPLLVVEQIYETPEFLPLIDLEQAKVTLQDLATSLQKMQVDYKQVDDKRNYLEARFGEMTSSIETTIDATEKNKVLIGDTLTRISLLETNVNNLKEELKKLKRDLGTAREQVTSYLLFLYQSYQ